MSEDAELIATMRNNADVLLAPATLQLPAPHLSASLIEAADRIEALSSALDQVTRERDDNGLEAFTLRNERDDYKKQSANWMRLHDEQEARAEALESNLTQAVRQEREQCLAAVEPHVFDDHALAQATDYGRGVHDTAVEIADAIRSRSNIGEVK